MTWIDWLIVAAYILSIVAIGIYFAKEASESTEDFFVAGRKLSWFMAGTSMVATTFSADTPLFVAGMTREQGIGSNWFWWCMAIGQIIAVFFFARLWRRTEVVTDIEFLTLRYAPSPARTFLRVFKVVFDGLLINCLTLAVVLLSITKILKALLQYEEVVYFQIGSFSLNTTLLIMIVLALCPLLFTILAGLHGVVTAEVMQFGMAMFGSITLATIVYFALSTTGDGNIFTTLAKAPDFNMAKLNFAPNLGTWNFSTFSFIILISIGWWSSAPSNGYFVQRMLASRSERDSLLGLLWFNIAHYILRPWPWIIVGIASLYYFPQLSGSLAETAYPNMVNMFLPIGLKGLMVASLFAAFMSTTDTHLNWGTSYLINDLYMAYIKPGQTTRHYLKATRIIMTFLTLITLMVSTALTGILDTFQFIYSIMGGVSLVLILRWYWWRVNVWAELTALVSSLIIASFLHFNPEAVVVLAKNLTGFTIEAGMDTFAFKLLINTSITSVLWIIVAMLTQPKPDAHAMAFYQRMRIASPGWKKVARILGITPEKGEFTANLVATLICIVFLYSLLLAIGYAVFQRWNWSLTCFAITLLAGFNLQKAMKRLKF
jgi:solute:Na+ symporter, SSS family